MQEVWVQEKARVLIWPGVHVEAPENMRVFCPAMKKAFIVADKGAAAIAERVVLALQMVKIDVSGCFLVLANPLKAVGTLPRICERLAKFGADASCAVVAIGSGLYLELAAAAARQHKGELPMFLIPTTLEAQADVAVGGSTAPCPAEGRRAPPAWYPPLAVFSDPTLLETLPLRNYIAGLAQAVRCAMIHDAELYELLDKRALDVRDRSVKLLEDIIFRCASVKTEFAEKDPAQPGPRRCLDYGHTIGRALERVAGAAVLHGEALAVGMEAEAFIAHELGVATDDVVAAQNKILKGCGLPTRARGVPAETLIKALEPTGNGSAFALPAAVGSIRYPVEVPPDLVAKAVAHVTR
jgi:3-dehydroquinate synthase